MSYNVDIYNDIKVITVPYSRATLEKAGEFKDAIMNLVDTGTKKVVVDLTYCDFIDSTFLGALVAALKKLVATKGNLKLIWNSEIKSSTFYLTGLNKVFEIYPQLDDAINDFKIDS